MAIIMQNENGTIKVPTEVIAMMAGLSAMECFGVVGMAVKDVKDGIVHLLKLESLTKGIKVVVDDTGIVIDLHIIVEYGINITAITETLVEMVQYKVNEAVDVKVKKIIVHVDGVRIDR